MTINPENFESFFLKISEKKLVNIFTRLNKSKKVLTDDYFDSFSKLFNVRTVELEFLLEFLKSHNFLVAKEEFLIVTKNIPLKKSFINFQSYYLNQILLSEFLRHKIFGFEEYQVIESNIIIDIKNVDIELRPIFITLEGLGIVETFEKSNLKKVKNISLAKTIFKKSLIKISKKDFEKIQKRKSEKGELAEIFVMNYEIEKLNKTKYTPQKISDLYVNLGYDIESYDLNGNKMYIEVKTMVNNKYIIWTKNEIGCSVNYTNDYYLYCVNFKDGSPNSIFKIIKNPYEKIINDGEFRKENTGDLIVYIDGK